MDSVYNTSSRRICCGPLDCVRLNSLKKQSRYSQVDIEHDLQSFQLIEETGSKSSSIDHLGQAGPGAKRV
jgi:hypothetical protein